VAGALIDIAYLEALYGTVEDEDRADALILIASDLVNEELGSDYDSADAPARAKQAVALLTVEALSATGDDFAVTAEQVGDWRAEYGQGRRAMNLDTVEHLLRRLRGSAYSVTTPIALDGPLAEADWWTEVNEP